MGSKADEFSDETSLVNMTSQNSANVGDVSSSCKRRACDSVQNTTSETSNLISVNSNHGSLSENADSKESPRSADITDALEVEMQPKLSFVKNAEWVEQYPKTSAHSNRYEDSRGAHDDDDNISCISRGNDAHVADSNLSRNVDKKNLSCSSFSVSSLNKEYDRRAHEPSSHIPSSNHTVSPSNSLKVGDLSILFVVNFISYMPYILEGECLFIYLFFLFREKHLLNALVDFLIKNHRLKKQLRMIHVVKNLVHINVLITF